MKIKNFRAVPSFKTVDGRRIRENVLFRSADISSDGVELKKYNITAVVDLRSPSEVNENPDVLPENIVYKHFPPLNDTENPAVNKNNRLEILSRLMRKEGGTKRYLCDTYKNLVLSQDSLCAYKKLILTLIDNDGKPCLWHCTQGKDRTGIATAVVLMALGVSRNDIVRDYLSYNRRNRFKNRMIFLLVAMAKHSITTAKSLNHLLSANADYINSALKIIDENYESDIDFIKFGLGLLDADVEKLRKLFLV